jgi:hypothetical protein
MRLVSVAGACSRAGKTAAAVTVLRHLGTGAASAVKFTTTEDAWEGCPRGTPCVVCDIEVPFRVIEDPVVLREAGTDTDRLWQAGARRVLWAIARQSAVASAWRAVTERLAGEERVVMEGSTIVSAARPDHTMFVVHPFLSPSRWKPTSTPLLRDADLVVVNRPAEEPREPSGPVLDALDAARCFGRVVVADVTRPLREWAPEWADELSAPDQERPDGRGHAHAHLPRP